MSKSVLTPFRRNSPNCLGLRLQLRLQPPRRSGKRSAPPGLPESAPRNEPAGQLLRNPTPQPNRPRSANGRFLRQAGRDWSPWPALVGQKSKPRARHLCKRFFSIGRNAPMCGCCASGIGVTTPMVRLLAMPGHEVSGPARVHQGWNSMPICKCLPLSVLRLI